MEHGIVIRHSSKSSIEDHQGDRHHRERLEEALSDADVVVFIDIVLDEVVEDVGDVEENREDEHPVASLER